MKGCSNASAKLILFFGFLISNFDMKSFISTDKYRGNFMSIFTIFLYVYCLLFPDSNGACPVLN